LIEFCNGRGNWEYEGMVVMDELGLWTLERRVTVLGRLVSRLGGATFEC
jgi:hypothetical protein